MDIRKEFLRFSETDNKILNIMLKHTLHTGPALVGFFGGFSVFVFFLFSYLTPLCTNPAPTPTYTHPF